LQKDPTKRPEAKKLIQHTFITQQINKGVDNLTQTLKGMAIKPSTDLTQK